MHQTMERVEYYYKKVSQLLLKPLTSTEQNYTVIEKECFLICHATEKFNH